MKLLQKIVPYKLKRALPFLGLATLGAGATFTACDKEPEPEHHNVTLEFGMKPVEFLDSISVENVTKHAKNPYVDTIYFKLYDNDNCTGLATNQISIVRNYLEERVNIAPQKVRGRGDFWFCTGRATTADSLWFVQNGWTINQLPQHHPVVER